MGLDWALYSRHIHSKLCTCIFMYYKVLCDFFSEIDFFFIRFLGFEECAKDDLHELTKLITSHTFKLKVNGDLKV